MQANEGNATPQIRQGGCICGAVRYRALGKPLRVTVCHCTFCQRRTGGALSIHAWFEADNTALDGELGTYEHRSDESNFFLRLHFCRRCATTVMLTLEKRPALRLIMVGTLDDPKSVEVDFHVWRRSAQPWICLPESVAAFERSSSAGAIPS